MIIANHRVTHCLAVLVFVHRKQADTAKDAKLGKGLGARAGDAAAQGSLLLAVRPGLNGI